jgi:hypothetical protein
MGNAVHSLQGGGERALRDRDHKQGEEKFALNFPELVSAGDRFIVQYAASVMSKGQPVSGHILLTNRHLCFVNLTTKDAIPLDTIVSIQPSVALKTFHDGLSYFMPIPKNYVMPDSIQLFVSDHKVLQFLDFDTIVDKVTPGPCHCRNIDMFYNWIDHQWRRTVRVPVEGVQYTHDAHYHGEQLHDVDHHRQFNAEQQHRESLLGQKAGALGPQTQQQTQLHGISTNNQPMQQGMTAQTIPQAKPVTMVAQRDTLTVANADAQKQR